MLSAVRSGVINANTVVPPGRESGDGLSTGVPSAGAGDSRIARPSAAGFLCGAPYTPTIVNNVSGSHKFFQGGHKFSRSSVA